MTRKSLKNIGATMALVVITIAVGIVGHYETHYNREGIVTKVEGNITTITDTTGNTWEVEDEDIAIGTNVTLKMHTQGTTNNITDDTIIKVIVR